MHSIILASDTQKQVWRLLTSWVGRHGRPSRRVPQTEPPVLFCVPCAVSAAVACLILGRCPSHSSPLLHASPRLSLVPSGESTEKWRQHVCPLRLTHFLWRNILHVHQFCCKGEVSFFFMAEWGAPLMLWQTDPSSLPAPLSTGVQVAVVSTAVRNTGVWMPLRTSFHFLSCQHPQVGLPGLFNFRRPSLLSSTVMAPFTSTPAVRTARRVPILHVQLAD